MYIDHKTQESIAIERKSVIWPKDYVPQAKIYDEIAHSIASHLRKVASRKKLIIFLSIRINKPNKNTTNIISDEISKEIIKIISYNPYNLSHKSNGEYSWNLKIEHATPSRILIESTDQEEDITYSPPCNEFLNSFSKLIISATNKFKSKIDSKGILLLEPFGQILHADKSWWIEVIKKCTIPDEIKEIWIQLPKFNSESEYTYFFDRIFPYQK